MMQYMHVFLPIYIYISTHLAYTYILAQTIFLHMYMYLHIHILAPQHFYAYSGYMYTCMCIAHIYLTCTCMCRHTKSILKTCKRSYYDLIYMKSNLINPTKSSDSVNRILRMAKPNELQQVHNHCFG